MNPIQSALREFADQKVAAHSQKYLRAEIGGYGFGDFFLGVRMPVVRQVAKANKHATKAEVEGLVLSKYHEERMVGLLILVDQYGASETAEQQENIFQVYVSYFESINNWDLVDVTCPHIIGKHLYSGDRSILDVWAQSPRLWTRRIAMISTFWFIRQGDLTDTFRLATALKQDPHDLIHKAVGWMLREAGKRDLEQLESFLKTHYQALPRTMLRYAIEKFPEPRRKAYLKGLV